MIDNFGEIGRNPDRTQFFLEGYAAVNGYNKQHVGPTGITFPVIMELYRSDQPDYARPDSTPQDEAEFDRYRVIEDQEDQLAMLGIKLDVQPPAFTYNVLIGPVDVDKSQIPPLLVMKVGEVEQFGETIERLNPEADQKELIESGINEILENTLNGIKDLYRGLTGDDEASLAFQRHDAETQMDALVALNPLLMANNYGTEKLRQELATCIIRHQDNTLEEYVQAEDMGLLKPDGGAAAWVLYMDAASLESSWHAALDLLRDLRSKEGDSQFYPELFAKVRDDFNQMIAMIQSDEYKAALTVGVDPVARMKSLDEVAKRLEELWSKDFNFENLFHPVTDKPDEDIK